MRAFVKFTGHTELLVLDVTPAAITEDGINTLDMGMDEFNRLHREAIRAALLSKFEEYGATHVWFEDERGTDKDPLKGAAVKVLEKTVEELEESQGQPRRSFPEVKLDVLAENARKYDQN